jgi:UPF0716 family protein affecting phage T7 exclusion
MGKLILLGVAIAIADPILLIVIYSHAGLEALLAIVFLPPIVGGRLAAWCKLRAQRNASSDAANGLGDQVLLTASVFMFAYPGPISTVLATLLLIPFARRLIQAWTVKRIMKAVAGGNLSVMPIGSGAIYSTMNANVEGFRTEQSTGSLKRAEGTVIDIENTPRLEAPENSSSETDPDKRP